MGSGLICGSMIASFDFTKASAGAVSLFSSPRDALIAPEIEDAAWACVIWAYAAANGASLTAGSRQRLVSL